MFPPQKGSGALAVGRTVAVGGTVVALFGGAASSVGAREQPPSSPAKTAKSTARDVEIIMAASIEEVRGGERGRSCFGGDRSVLFGVVDVRWPPGAPARRAQSRVTIGAGAEAGQSIDTTAQALWWTTYFVHMATESISSTRRSPRRTGTMRS